MKKCLRSLRFSGLTLLLLACFFSPRLSAQHLIIGGEKVEAEIGLNFGPTFFLGDLGGNRGLGTKFVKDVNIQLTKLMKGGFISVYPSTWLGLRFAGQYTFVEGRDEIITPKGGYEMYRKQRNLDFKSHMWEVYGAIEIFPMMWLNRNHEDYLPNLRPYFFIGAGLFHFNPKGSLTDANGNKTWHYLRPLRTEGQGMSEYPDRQLYALTQVNIPMGGGIKYFVSDRLNVAFELLYRKTFTDYIDDLSTSYIDPVYFDKYLSPENANIATQIHDKTVWLVTTGISRFKPGEQRGNPKNYDDYFSFALKFGFRLGTDFESKFARHASRVTSCPLRF